MSLKQVIVPLKQVHAVPGTVYAVVHRTPCQGNVEKQASKTFLGLCHTPFHCSVTLPLQSSTDVSVPPVDHRRTGIAPWRSRWIVLTPTELNYYNSNKVSVLESPIHGQFEELALLHPSSLSTVAVQAGEEKRGGLVVSEIEKVEINTKKRPWG